MKKNKLILSVLAMAFAMSLASCSSENSSNDNNQNNNSGQNSDDNNNNNNNGNNDKEEDENPFYRLVLEPNEEFLKSQKSKIQKVNGRTSEVIDYEFIVPEKEVAEVTNYNDLLIGANPLLLTPIAIEMNEDIVVRTLTAEETKSEFNPITEFSKSGYGDANIDSSLYNTEQLRTCYSISQSESGTLQSKYYNVSIVIEDNEAPVLNQTGVAELPFTLDIDSIKSSLNESILSSLTDNNSNTTLTVTLKDDPILTGLTNLNKEQVIHFDATDSDGNKIENQEFKYKLVDTLNYFENIDQTTVTDISYKSANIDYITSSFSRYSDIYRYELLNEEELVTNEGSITEELKEVINKEQTVKYAVYEKDVLVGEFNYKFKMIDDVAPYMVWADDGSEITCYSLNDLTAEHDNNLNVRYGINVEFLDPMSLYEELIKYVIPKDEIYENPKLIMNVSLSKNKAIKVNFKSYDNNLFSNTVTFGSGIQTYASEYSECIENYILGNYDENGLIK